jgi:hypothetical protein
MAPRRVVGLLQVEEDPHDMLAAQECLLDEAVNPYQVVDGTSVPPKATLDAGEKVPAFKTPN